jgi:crotonobetainyl-CoA:carnitine CoA-transferase CaiB-like acyl-CoA transferase
MRVLEATTTWAGPMCGCLLADMGADVVKVELPGGEVIRILPPAIPGSDPPVALSHGTVNRNKRSLTLDLRRDRGRDLFLELARRADVLVENFRPGTMARWGVGYEQVAAVKPDIVYVSISGFGQFGPDHDRVGYDPVAQATSGFVACTVRSRHSGRSSTASARARGSTSTCRCWMRCSSSRTAC